MGVFLFHVEFVFRMFAVFSHHIGDGPGLRVIPHRPIAPSERISATQARGMPSGLSMSGLATDCSICVIAVASRARFSAAAGGDPRGYTRKDTISNPLLF